MNEVIKYTGQLGKTILNFFPADPFENVIVQFSAMFDNAVLEYLNYFIPVGPFLKILAIWLSRGSLRRTAGMGFSGAPFHRLPLLLRLTYNRKEG